MKISCFIISYLNIILISGYKCSREIAGDLKRGVLKCGDLIRANETCQDEECDSVESPAPGECFWQILSTNDCVLEKDSYCYSEGLKVCILPKLRHGHEMYFLSMDKFSKKTVSWKFGLTTGEIDCTSLPLKKSLASSDYKDKIDVNITKHEGDWIQISFPKFHRGNLVIRNMEGAPKSVIVKSLNLATHEDQFSMIHQSRRRIRPGGLISHHQNSVSDFAECLMNHTRCSGVESRIWRSASGASLLSLMATTFMLLMI